MTISPIVPNTPPNTPCDLDTSTHTYDALKSSESDLTQVLIHFFNNMVKSQLEAQNEALKASYEYLKVMKLGKHVRKD